MHAEEVAQQVESFGYAYVEQMMEDYLICRMCQCAVWHHHVAEEVNP